MTEKLKIKSVYINNFRSISKIDDLIIDGGLIPIVGMNGAGKSNILKAIHWFSDDKVDYSNEDGYLHNIYNKDNNKKTIVSLKFAISGSGPYTNSNADILKSVLSESVDKLVNEFNNILGNSSALRKLDAYVKEILNVSFVEILKVSSPGTKNIYKFKIDLPNFNIESLEDIKEIKEVWSEIIYKNIILSVMPKIYLLDTKETLKEFENNSDEENVIGDDNLRFSFKRMFEWTEFESKAEDKFKVINKILQRTKTGYEFDDFIRLNNSTSSSQVSIMNESNSKDLLKLQKEFGEAITSNGFFRSINSDNEFTIYPEFSATKFNDDNPEIEKLDDAYRLVLFDTITYDDGEKKNIPVKNISFKNDGFIFALILFMEIDFLIEDDSLLLIDEPANFLSTPSIKLLMENFKRISNEKKVKFIFTTHSSYTLDKNLVNIDDIIIAKKGKNFSTKIYNFSDDNIKYESEIIADEYNGTKKGRGLIMYENTSLNKATNYLIKAKSQIQKDFVEFLNEYTEKNIVPLYDVKLVQNNISKYYDENSKFITKEKRALSKIEDLISNDDIKILIGKYELTPEGAVNEYKLKNDKEYKISLIKRIFSKFNRDFKGLKRELNKSNELISNKIKEILGEE